MLNFVAVFFFLIVFIVNVCFIYIQKERKKIIKLKKKEKYWRFVAKDSSLNKRS